MPSESRTDAPSESRTDAPFESRLDAPSELIGNQPIEWGPVRYERIRSLAAGFGLLLALAVLIGLTIVVTGAGTALISADLPTLLAGVSAGDAFVSVVLLGALALLTLPYAYLYYAESELEPSSLGAADGALSSLRPTWVLAGVAAPLALWGFGPHWLTAGGVGLVPALWVVPMLALQSGATHRLDPGNAVLERTGVSSGRTRSDDLDAVIRIRRIDLPWTTLFLLAYRGNAWYRSTPWAFAPTDVADDVEEALDAVLARSDGPDRASLAERLVLAVVGSSSLVVGVAIAVAAGEGAAGAVLAILMGPFSLLFLALAARL